MSIISEALGVNYELFNGFRMIKISYTVFGAISLLSPKLNRFAVNVKIEPVFDFF